MPAGSSGGFEQAGPGCRLGGCNAGEPSRNATCFSELPDGHAHSPASECGESRQLGNNCSGLRLTECSVLLSEPTAGMSPIWIATALPEGLMSRGSCLISWVAPAELNPMAKSKSTHFRTKRRKMGPANLVTGMT